MFLFTETPYLYTIICSKDISAPLHLLPQNSQFKYGKKTNKNKKTKTETVESYEKPFSNRHTHTNQPLRLLYTNANLQFTDVLHFFFDYHTLHKNALCARQGFIHLLAVYFVHWDNKWKELKSCAEFCIFKQTRGINYTFCHCLISTVILVLLYIFPQ